MGGWLVRYLDIYLFYVYETDGGGDVGRGERDPAPAGGDRRQGVLLEGGADAAREPADSTERGDVPGQRAVRPAG